MPGDREVARKVIEQHCTGKSGDDYRECTTRAWKCAGSDTARTEGVSCPTSMRRTAKAAMDERDQ